MAKRIAIPNEIKEEVQTIVATYNAKHKLQYVAECRGAFCYFSRLSKRPFFFRVLSFLFGIKHKTNIVETKLARLTWTGNIARWDFSDFSI